MATIFATYSGYALGPVSAAGKSFQAVKDGLLWVGVGLVLA